jgi:hypothetical protein|tara:strand:- start:593 stop:829 length:237 start_codon:yes stop_codon:yes gene_type:complete
MAEKDKKKIIVEDKTLKVCERFEFPELSDSFRYLGMNHPEIFAMEIYRYSSSKSRLLHLISQKIKKKLNFSIVDMKKT